jgi:hypothetical protein
MVGSERWRAQIVVGGEVVTVHKIRTAAEDGRLQVTCCSPGACGYLMEQLSNHPGAR